MTPRQARKLLKLTQAQMAKKIKCSTGKVSTYERLGAPHEHLVNKFAFHYNCPPTVFYPWVRRAELAKTKSTK